MYKIKDILRLHDLTKQEIDVYVALLQLRKATIPMIREKTKLPNITVYRTVQELQEKQLVTAEPINKKTNWYMPLSLEVLIQKLSAEQRKLRRMELELKNLDRLLPYVNFDEEGTEEIEVRVGRDAFREEYLKMPDIFKDEYLHIGSTTNFWETAQLNYEAPEERTFIHKRLAKNLFARALDPVSPTAEMIRLNDSREKRTMKLSNDIPILKDFLMISENQISHFVCDVDHPRVVIIRNPELVRSHHRHFEHLWKSAR